MRVLITGGAGVVGRALCEELLSANVCVRVLTLPGDEMVTFLPRGVEVFYGDITKAGELEPAFKNVDIVFHLAAILLSIEKNKYHEVNVLGTKNVVEVAQKMGVKRILYVSSISVTYPVLTPYGKSKLEGETLIKNSGLLWTIVRPTLVVGNGGGIEYNMFAHYVSKFPIYFLPGKGKALKRPVKTEDLVRGILQAGLRDTSLFNVYNLAGPDILTLAEMAKAILRKEKKHHLMVSIPWFLARFLARFKKGESGVRVSKEQALAGFLYDAAPSIEEAERDLAYKPTPVFIKSHKNS